MTNEKHMTEASLEEISGGIQSLYIGRDAGLVVDNSVNDSFNTQTVTKVDASTKILDSFNTTSFRSRFGF